MGNCYACDVVLFENFGEFFSVRPGVVKLWATDGYPFALHEGVMEVFDCHGGAVSGNQQLHVFIERRLHREKADFDGPLGLLGSGACGGGNFLGFVFEVFVYFLLVEGFCFPLGYRYGALWAVPQTGTKPVAVGFFDYLGFAVHDLEAPSKQLGMQLPHPLQRASFMFTIFLLTMRFFSLEAFSACGAELFGVVLDGF